MWGLVLKKVFWKKIQIKRLAGPSPLPIYQATSCKTNTVYVFEIYKTVSLCVHCVIILCITYGN